MNDATAFARSGQDALTARAVEPAAGHSVAEGGDGHTHEIACLNCATRLIGSHCHACGQAAHVHRTIGAFFHDLAHGVFHVEGKVWRTLPLLAWHPGRLTRQYIDGRRASYVSPIALFLFAVFLLFSAMHLLERSKDSSRPTTNFATGPAKADGKDREVHSDIPLVTHAIEIFRANPDLALYKLQASAYKYSWLLIPMSVPMLWLLFPFNRRFHLYDHTVFITYSLSFMTLLAIVYTLVDAAGLPIAGLLVLVAPMHMYRQLHGTYATSGFGTLWRTAALCGFACVALVAFALLLLSAELSG